MGPRCYRFSEIFESIEDLKLLENMTDVFKFDSEFLESLLLNRRFETNGRVDTPQTS